MIAIKKINRHLRRRSLGVQAGVLILAVSMMSPYTALGQQSQGQGSARAQDAAKKADKSADTSKKSDSLGPAAPKSVIKVVPVPGQTPPPAGGANPGQGSVTFGPGGEGRSVDIGGGGLGGGRGRAGGFSNQGGLISMDFRGTDINNVLKGFAMMTGWQIVVDPTLTGNVTIISPKQLTIDQAFEVLQASLHIRGFTGQFEKHGDTTILNIVSLPDAFKSGSTILRTDTSKPNPDELKNQVVTQVIPIENVDARTLAQELTPLVSKGASIVGSSGTNGLIVTDIAANVARISNLVEMLDKAASNTDMKMFSLSHADATDVANIINSMFRQVFNRGGQGGQPGQPGQPGFNPGQPVQMGPNGQPIAGGPAARAAIIAVPDTRTNAIFVAASKENLKKVGDLIAQLDDPDSTALKTKFRKLQYADAATVADVVNGVLSGSNPTRSTAGNNNFQNRIFGGGFGGFGGFNGQQGTAGQVQSTDPFAKVVAEQRTNSLIITATEEKMAKIDDLVDQLDVNVPTETTTFVVPLNNAHAEDVAYILGQAFGTGTNSNNQFGNFGFLGFGNNNQNRNNRNQAQNRRLGSGSNGRTGRAVKLDYNDQGPTEDDVVHGSMTPNGFVPDNTPSTTSRGQFFFGGGRGFGGQQMQTPSFGRGSNGRQSALLQLRQNVGVYADPNTNQLVIQTNPENLDAIKQIIKELDVIPRQVMIEVVIAEATLDATNKLGVQFDVNGIGKILGTDITQTGSSNFPVGSAGSTAQNIASPINPGGNYGIQAGNGRFRALVQALQQDSRVKILSTPKIFASNNQDATIDITTNIPYVTGSTTNAFAGGTTVTTDFLNVGVTLEVTPRITKDKLVTVDVHASASEFLGFDILSSTVDANGRVTTQPAPRTSERTTDTSVTVRDGEPIVLGGLMRDSTTINVAKIPLLADIPIIGPLFRSTNRNTVKTELMIFLIPHVVDGEDTSRALVDREGANIRRAFPDLEKQQPTVTPKTPGFRPEDVKKPDQKSGDKKSDKKATPDVKVPEKHEYSQPNPAERNDPPR